MFLQITKNVPHKTEYFYKLQKTPPHKTEYFLQITKKSPIKQNISTNPKKVPHKTKHFHKSQREVSGPCRPNETNPGGKALTRLRLDLGRSHCSSSSRPSRWCQCRSCIRLPYSRCVTMKHKTTNSRRLLTALRPYQSSGNVYSCFETYRCRDRQSYEATTCLSPL
jgi:hypothetical protein